MPSGQRGSGGQAEWQITDTRHPVQPCWLLSRHTHGVWLQTLPRSTRPGRPQPPAALGRAEIWTGTHNLPPKPASLSGLLASARPPGWLRSTAGSLDHGKGRINLGRLFWGRDFQPGGCVRDGSPGKASLEAGHCRHAGSTTPSYPFWRKTRGFLEAPVPPVPSRAGGRAAPLAAGAGWRGRAGAAAAACASGPAGQCRSRA